MMRFHPRSWMPFLLSLLNSLILKQISVLLSRAIGSLSSRMAAMSVPRARASGASAARSILAILG